MRVYNPDRSRFVTAVLMTGLQMSLSELFQIPFWQVVTISIVSILAKSIISRLVERYYY